MNQLSSHPSTLSLSQLVTELESDTLQGLSQTEAQKRNATWGLNVLPAKKHRTPLQIFVHQFTSPLIYLLFGSAALTFAIGEKTDAFVVVLVVLVNSLIGLIQEIRAEKKMTALETYLAPTAKVFRAEHLHKIPAEQLTVGDIIILEAGDQVPADARIFEANQLSCNEASFTGESLPTRKDPQTFNQEKALSEQKNMVFAGATVTNGFGKAIVTSIGQQTQLGHISHLLNQLGTSASPLEKNITKLSQGVLFFVSLAVIAVVVLGLVNSYSLLGMIKIGVSLAVSAIPEGLPVVVTITLSLGVWRMAKANSVIRKLDAVETLGSVDIICTDKTGTLTTGEMMVNQLSFADQEITVSGQGYSPEGIFFCQEKQLDPQKNDTLQLATLLAILSSDARTEKIEKNGSPHYQPIGDPTEVALYVLGKKAQLHLNTLKKEYQQCYSAPFDQVERYSVKVYQHQHKFLTIVKGSPEILLKLSHPAPWSEKTAHTQTGLGHRVITIAFAETDSSPIHKDGSFILPKISILCNLSLSDPLRTDAAAAIQACRQSGIRTLMITGDHTQTAQHIAQQIGLATDALSGPEAEKMSDTELSKKIANISIISRATPQLKLRLVQLFQAQEKVVVMTGDGVNDSPALKQANVGVAMGRSGSDVAMSVADMVLTDDNFASILKAVEQGRVIWQNLRKVLFYLFSTSLAEILVILISLIFNLPLPLLATQILWLNLVTDGFLDVTLATEGPEHDVMSRPPRNKHEQILDGKLVWRLLFTGAWMAGIGVVFFISELPVGIDKARTLVLVNLAALQWFNAWNARSERKTVFEQSPLGNKALLVGLGCCVLLQVLATSWSPLQTLLHTTSLSLKEWAICVSAASTILLVDVAWKKVVFPLFLRTKITLKKPSKSG